MSKKNSNMVSTVRSESDFQAAMRLARGGTTGTQRISLLFYHAAGIQVATLTEGSAVVVGRDESVVDICVDDEKLSRRHARFELQQQTVWVEDLRSTNGTKCNGQRVTRVRVGPDDEITIGSVAVSTHALAPVDEQLYGLESHDRFVTLLADEVVRARTFGRTFGIMMLRVRGRGEKSAAALAPSLRKLLRGVDRLALYSPDTFEILLPELSQKQLAEYASRLVNAQPTEELSGEHVSLRCGGAIYPTCGTSAGRLIGACCEALRQANAQTPISLGHAVKQRSLAPSEGTVNRDSEPVLVSSPMKELYETVDRLAQSVITVLLTGETGTGKDVLARALHERGPRKQQHMACVNCGAIPASLVESVLFGHERGAFTGASQQSKGLFEEADGGTIFLDEVGELTPATQAALLRVLEERHIRRVGSNKEIPVDVRVIAATHRDLEAMCEAETFRWDLFYRLNAMTLAIPPLRDRPEDIPAFVQRFTRQAAANNNCDIEGIDEDAMRLLLHYVWPGNVRELRNALERAVVISRTGRITVDDLPQRIIKNTSNDNAVSKRRTRPTLLAENDNSNISDKTLAGGADIPDESIGHSSPDTAGMQFRDAMQHYETQLIVDALRESRWNRTATAKRLGIPVRTLSHKIQQLGIKKLGYGVED